jgi:hypothetical protein
MAAVLVVVFVVMTTLLFIKPDLNAPERSDAVVVLGGSNTAAPPEGLKLVEEGYAPVVAYSLAPGVPCVASAVKRVDPSAKVICFYAEPQTTQGEGRSIKHLAALHGWKKIIVVMPIPQASRARLRIGRCYSGQVLEVGVEPQGFWDWIRELAYEWGAMVKAEVLQPTC